jgi:hypothetical protein
MSYELAKKFADFKIPQEVEAAYRQGSKLMGSLGFTRMMMFALENQLNNDVIDYFMNIPPQRMEDESKEDMKMRGKFSNALYKYRAHLYDYSVYNK